MKIERVVVATQFERASLSEVRCLLALREAGLREIVFLYVVDRDEVGFNVTTGFDRALLEELEEKARLHFVEWEREIVQRGVFARHRMELGSPAGKILETACEEKADLLAIGSHHTALDAIYPHGVDLEIVRRSSMPVLVFRPDRKKGEGEEPCDPFGRVLFPTDFSEVSGRAFRFVQGLKGAVRRVELLYVLTDREIHGKPPEEVREREEQARKELGRMAGELRAEGMEADVHLYSGEVVEEIAAAAAEWRCDCVVMGTTGKHGLKEVAVGSPSHDILLEDIPLVILVPRENPVCYD